MQRAAGLTPIGEILDKVFLHSAKEYAEKREMALSKINPAKEFMQGGEIYCKSCRKVKSFDDAEATVVAHLPGQGRYAGQTGALLVEMPSGHRFRLGSGLNPAQRRTPPAVGSTVTYRFNGYHASGLPRFARFWRVRTEGAPPVAPTAGAASTP